jgi:hypothetical protein
MIFGTGQLFPVHRRSLKTHGDGAGSQHDNESANQRDHNGIHKNLLLSSTEAHHELRC